MLIMDSSIKLQKDDLEYLKQSKNILSEYAKMKRNKLMSQKLKEYESKCVDQYWDIRRNREN